MSRLLSGVRSSCDMLARNSDLYLEVVESCSAFSSSDRRACSTSRFLTSTFVFCSASRRAFSSSSSACFSSAVLVRRSSACCVVSSFDCDCSSCVSDCDCCSSSSVRMLAPIMLSTTPIDCVSWSRNSWWMGLKGLERGQLDHRLDLSLEQDRQDDDGERRRLAETGADLDVVRRNARQQDRLLLQRALPDQALARLEPVADPLALPVGVGRHQLEDRRLRRVVLGVDDEEGAVVRGDQRRQLAHDQARHRLQILLPLHHRAELGEVRLQPVLLGVLLRRLAQVDDHLVDLVFERGDLALRLDLDRPGQVPLGDRGRDVGDGAHLRRQIAGQLVDVVGQLPPGADGARHLGLAAQLPFDADLARHRRDLVGERSQRVAHVVDGVGQRGDLALGLDADQLLGRDRRWRRR